MSSSAMSKSLNRLIRLAPLKHAGQWKFVDSTIQNKDTKRFSARVRLRKGWKWKKAGSRGTPGFSYSTLTTLCSGSEVRCFMLRRSRGAIGHVVESLVARPAMLMQDYVADSIHSSFEKSVLPTGGNDIYK